MHKIEGSLTPKALTIKITGLFSYGSQNDFLRVYHECEQKPNQVIVDLSETQTMDSSAIGALCALKEEMEENGNFTQIELKIASNKNIKHLLDRTNIADLFKIT